jgi:ABC-type lipoprotein export system ATPase subunit
MVLLQSLNSEGHTVIVVTHNSDMGAYATRSIRVRDGECFG